MNLNCCKENELALWCVLQAQILHCSGKILAAEEASRGIGAARHPGALAASAPSPSAPPPPLPCWLSRGPSQTSLLSRRCSFQSPTGGLFPQEGQLCGLRDLEHCASCDRKTHSVIVSQSLQRQGKGQGHAGANRS